MAKDERATNGSHFAVFAALMALALVSYLISFAPLGAMRVPASLVVVFFMELVRQRPTNRFVVIAAMLMVSTLTGLMVVDVLTRDTPPMLPATFEQTR
jgi:uncharacterized protein YqgC (DUF456 family)